MATNNSFTESDLEASISNVLRIAFPMLSATDIKHQRTFRIRLGHKTHEIKIDEHDWAAGRLDILLTIEGRPFAILELKRPGLALADEDRAQGLSYARLIERWPPLVIVSNGTDTQIYETFTAALWNPQGHDDASLASLLSTASAIANSDLKNAVETLLGFNNKCWTSLIKTFTQEQLDRMTGDWDDLLLPFPKDLLFHRKATALLRLCLEQTDFIPFIVGPPLSGKSNVIREFILEHASTNNHCVLYVDADSYDHGVFQTIANLMTKQLGWAFDVNQARAWLNKLSNSDCTTKFVLVVDGSNVTSLKAELDEIATGGYGPNLRLIVSIDQGMANALLRSKNGRNKTAIGTKACLIDVPPFDDEEFEIALKTLYDLRFEFMHGSHLSADYRIPWLLRSLVALHSKEPNYANEKLAVLVPSVPGMQSFAYVNDRLTENDKLHGQFLKIAEAVISDATTGIGSVSASLLMITRFVCKCETLQCLLGDSEIAELVVNGYIKHHTIDTHRLFVPQLATLISSCAAEYLATRIAADIEDPKLATDRLVAVCSKIPFGEVIGAAALYKH